MENTHEALKFNTVIIGMSITPQRTLSLVLIPLLVLGASGDLAKKKVSAISPLLRETHQNSRA